MKPSFTVIFRCDASAEIGSGHVMRCLALAQLMQSRSWQCSFLVNEEALRTAPALAQAGHNIYQVDTDSVPEHDLAIIDHYGLGASYEREARVFAKKVMVIDDVGGRPHDCDFLMDYAVLNPAMEQRHDLADTCQQFLGLGYVILRPEFHEVSAPHYQNPPCKIHVFFGSTDVAHFTLRLLNTITKNDLHHHYNFQIVIGSANPDKEEILNICNQYPQIELHVQVDNIASLIASCDFAIGCGGVAMWERMALGIPAIEFAHSPIQLETLEILHDMQAINFIGMGDLIENFLQSNALEDFLKKPPVLMHYRIGHQIPEMLGQIEKNLLGISS